MQAPDPIQKAWRRVHWVTQITRVGCGSAYLPRELWQGTRYYSCHQEEQGEGKLPQQRGDLSQTVVFSTCNNVQALALKKSEESGWTKSLD
jgi:hypothetical protein